MSNGYDQFFKKARQNAASGHPASNRSAPKAAPKFSTQLHHTVTEQDIETHIKKKLGVKPKKKKKVSWKLAGLSFVGLIVTAIGFVNHDKVEQIVSSVEISLIGSAGAQTNTPPPAAKDKAPASINEAAMKTETIETKEELDHLSKLREKKKELDAREEEISRMEAEVQKQQADLEIKIRELKQTREEISKMLEDRVKSDDQKVETLVQMYSNMRPPQAAKIFETLDEDLAIDILGRMKKKNAADIMNLLKPEKAQTFSEKYAGYKRK
jgi:flagellar motility protein MotE (MotC chaperone)